MAARLGTWSLLAALAGCATDPASVPPCESGDYDPCFVDFPYAYRAPRLFDYAGLDEPLLVQLQFDDAPWSLLIEYVPGTDGGDVGTDVRAFLHDEDDRWFDGISGTLHLDPDEEHALGEALDLRFEPREGEGLAYVGQAGFDLPITGESNGD